MNIKILKIMQRAKARLFKQCRIGIVNADDPHLDQMCSEGHTCTSGNLWIFRESQIFGQRMSVWCPGLAIWVWLMKRKGQMELPMWRLTFPGKFSVYNSLTAIAICHHFGVTSRRDSESTEKGKSKRPDRNGQSIR